MVSACPILAQEQYIKRQDEVCVQLHFNIQEIGVKLDNIHRYDYVPKSFETSHEGKVTISWNQQVQSDRTIPNNKPDIIICDNKKRHMHINRYCNFWRQKCDQDRICEDFNI